MLFATSETGTKIRASKGAIGICGECRATMRSKCGSIMTHHWAHKSRIDCDNWSEPEAEWHREWKSHFKPEEVEVTIKRDGLHHRADVHLSRPAVDGINTIEFQHSSISPEDMLCRESFYGSKNLLWVIDAQAAYSANRLNFKPIGQPIEGEYHHRADWKHGRKSFVNAKASIALDLGRYQDKPRAEHLILRVTEVGTYEYEGEYNDIPYLSDRMFVQGYFQSKAHFLSLYSNNK